MPHYEDECETILEELRAITNGEDGNAAICASMAHLAILLMLTTQTKAEALSTLAKCCEDMAKKIETEFDLHADDRARTFGLEVPAGMTAKN